MILKETWHFPNIEVKTFDGFLVNFIKGENINWIVRGLRTIEDYKQEKLLYEINTLLGGPDIQHIYIQSPSNFDGISSSFVKRLTKIKGWEYILGKLLPTASWNLMLKKFNGLRERFLLISDIPWKKIIENYCQEKRFYHNLTHITRCLKILDKLKGLEETTKKSIELALLFHDVIYIPEQPDSENVEQSCEFAKEVLTDINISPDEKELIIRLIQATDYSIN